MPVTVVLKSVAQSLPEIVTRARGSRGTADTVRTLELNGFYERRQTSGVAPSAFLTHEQVGKLTLLHDLPMLNGRQVCPTNLYLNGVRIDLSSVTANRARSQVAPPFRNALDALVNPGEVLGIEMYERPSETPAQYNVTQAGRCGATLIWTK
jgi:hypothetical protein